MAEGRIGGGHVEAEGMDVCMCVCAGGEKGKINQSHICGERLLATLKHGTMPRERRTPKTTTFLPQPPQKNSPLFTFHLC